MRGKFLHKIGGIWAPVAIMLLGAVFVSNNSAYAAAPYINVSSGAPDGLVSFSKVQPSSTGTVATASDTLTVNTNCAVGYSVYVSAINGGETSLVNDSASAVAAGNNTIDAASATVGGTAAALTADTWGVNYVDDGTYFGLPTYEQAIDSPLTTKSSVGTTTTVPIYYGAKVTTALAPGSYNGDVLYTVLPNTACTYYTVHYNANGGTGTMDDQDITVGEATDLSANAFTRSGYTFLGWSNSANGKTGTAVDGIGTEDDVDYQDKASITDIADFNTTKALYAIWRKDTYILTILNGNTTAVSSMAVNGTTKSSGDTTDILSATSTTVACTPKSGYHCAGWTSSDTSLLPNSSNASYTFNMPAGNITLTAKGAANTFTINYHANGGSGSASKTSETATYGTNVTMPTQGALSRSGYSLIGWSLSSTATSATWAAGRTGVAPTAIKSNVTTVNGGSVTIYAVWKLNYTISYAAGSTGGSCSAASATASGTMALSPSACTKSGYAQTGWSTSSSGNSKTYSIGQNVTDLGTRTLYPYFESVSTGTSCVLTATRGCRLNNKTWILGNGGEKVTWNDAFTNATGVNNHNATAKTGICPSGYSMPTISEYDALISYYGGTVYAYHRNGYLETTSALGAFLGKSQRYFWSSTESDGSNAYLLRNFNNGSNSSTYDSKSYSNYVLCYK